MSLYLKLGLEEKKLLLILFIIFMQGVRTYILETNHVPSVVTIHGAYNSIYNSKSTVFLH